MNSQFIAPPIKRVELRLLATKVRDLAGCNNRMCFPILEFLEYFVCTTWGYTLEIIEREKMLINHAETDLANKIIRIREDVYTGARGGKGRDRLTIAHEIGHILMHDEIKLARIDPDVQIPRYRDPEWQATAFAGELLIPYSLCKGKSTEEIVSCCKVSIDAAEFQLRIFEDKKRGN